MSKINVVRMLHRWGPIVVMQDSFFHCRRFSSEQRSGFFWKISELWKNTSNNDPTTWTWWYRLIITYDPEKAAAEPTEARITAAENFILLFELSTWQVCEDSTKDCFCFRLRTRILTYLRSLLAAVGKNTIESFFCRRIPTTILRKLWCDGGRAWSSRPHLSNDKRMWPNVFLKTRMCQVVCWHHPFVWLISSQGYEFWHVRAMR